MSAIVGIVNFDGHPVEPALLEKMITSLAHRGPDGQGKWLQGAVGFGHLALRTTPEASLESLPMDVADRFVITGDVRLDNRDDLLNSLAECQFLSKLAPDCAFVVAAYEKWGEACVEHFLGDFAFAIWDKSQRKLFCARDHMGVKPFYYAWISGRRLVFGTEVKAVLCVPDVAQIVNEQRIADGFVHLFNDPASTYYLAVSRLPAAHCLSVTNVMSMRRYWKLNPDRELRLNSDREYAERFRELFLQAVTCRMRSGHPVGSMLSGGLDSSSIACVARDWLKAQGKPKLHTFSGVFDEVSECDERHYIQTVLEQGHCEPDFTVLDSLSPLSGAETIIWHLDEPLSAGNLYLNWNAYRRIKKLGVRVVLDGFDGDTTVSHGTGRFAELAGAGKWLDLAIELRGFSRSLNVKKSWSQHWWNSYCKYHPPAHLVNRVGCGVMRRLRRLPSSKVPAWDPIEFLNPDLAQKLQLRELANKPAPRTKSERDRHLQLIEREIMTKTLELLDHTASAFNVEVRFPFMDIRLIEYCLSLPSDQKLRRGMTRFVMHHGMAGILPDKIQQRGDKSNLAPSFEKGLVKFERDNLGKVLLEEGGRLAAYMNLGRVNECLDRFRRGAAGENDTIAIWRTVGLALWLRSRTQAANNLS